MRTRTSVVTLNIKLETLTRQEGDQWLAWCPPIDVMSQGSTEEAALAALKEAIELWFESCLDRGVLDEALKEAGFTSGTRAQIASTGGVVLVEEQPMWRGKSRRAGSEYIEVMIPAYIAAHTAGSRATR